MVRLVGKPRASAVLAEARPGEPSPHPDAGSGAVVPGRLRQIAVAMRDTSRRNIYFSVASIPGHLLVAGWKGSLMIVSPSLFMLANLVFTLGLAVVKLLVVLDDRHLARTGDTAVAWRAYRASGLIVLLLAVAYIACCVPLAMGQASTERYSYEVAIAIAAVAFAELGFSIHGFSSSRRRGDLLMEAVKLSNLAASLILLVLTQTALLSMTSQTDHSRFNGICGIVMGAGAALIGLRLLVRRRAHAAR